MIKETFPHPSSGLQPEWITLIRSSAQEAELQGKLLPAQLELIEQQRWFSLLAPAAYGGLEASLYEAVSMEESLAWADGSLGWTVTLCCGAGWFGGFLEPGMAKQVFSRPKVCLAGSGAPAGTATETENGYIINGTLKYASGAHHATHFTANCVIKRDGETVLTPDGKPLISAFIIDCRHVTLVPTWKYIGMMGTGSHGFEIREAAVSKEARFRIEPEAAVIDSLVYKYPFLPLAEATTAVNLSGMAMRFIDLCEPIFAAKHEDNKLTDNKKMVLRAELEMAKDTMDEVRSSFYKAIQTSWVPNPSAELLKAVSSTSLQLAQTARECVDQLYPYCGLQAASPDTEINQVWRNLHTASQHSLLTFQE